MKYFLIAVLTFAWGITAGYGAPPLVTPMANPPSPALTSPENWLGSTGFQVSKNDAGKNVYEMLFNPQFIGDGSGGDGWIRLLEFSKDLKKVRVRTFSPLFALSGSTRNLSWHTAPFNQFEFVIE